MICPHCQTSLLRRERTDNTCSRCKIRFAFDPKTNSLGLNDLRVRRIVAKLTNEGQVPCTPGHLWYVLSRKSLGKRTEQLGCAWLALVLGLLLTAIAMAKHTTALVICGVVLLAIGLVLLIVSAVLPHSGRGLPPIPREAIYPRVLSRWKHIYDSLPAGMVDDHRYPTCTPSSSQGVLLCPDRSIAALLVAAELPQRHGLTLAADLGDLPGRGPVIVLHDAGAQGEFLVRRARETLTGRAVIDAGLPLRTVRSVTRAIPYRDRKPGKSLMATLAATGDFTADELKWLAQGWVFPLVGVPPRKLLAALTRVVERAGSAANTQRQAAALGFLTWPEEAR